MTEDLHLLNRPHERFNAGEMEALLAALTEMSSGQTE